MNTLYLCRGCKKVSGVVSQNHSCEKCGYQCITLPKLGKNAPVLDKRTLKLEKYTDLLPTPPTHVNWLSGVSKWQMFGNDTLGDCVEAAQCNMETQWLSYANPSLPFPTTAEAIYLYQVEGGYVPGNANTDNGTNMLTALKYWNHWKKPFAAINPKNVTLVKQSVLLFGNVFLGVQLPISAQGQSVWQVPNGGPYGDGSPGTWGGHCIPIVSYDPTGLIVITWGAKLFHDLGIFTYVCG